MQPTLFDLRPDVEPEAPAPRSGRSRPATRMSPPHNGTSTSRSAAEAIKPHVATLSERIFEAVRLAMAKGATREELSIGLGIPIQTVCARVNELLKSGDLVEAKGCTRKTVSGRRAVILLAWR